MKHFFCIAALTLLLPAARTQTQPDNLQPPVVAPDSDWARLFALSRGEKIVVRDLGNRTIRCEFAGAVDERLFCDPSPWQLGHPRPRWPETSSFELDRVNIETVRLDQERKNRWLIIAAAAAAGFGVGYAQKPLEGHAPRALGGVMLGGVFAFGGSLVAMGVSPFLPGKLVYRRRISIGHREPDSFQ